MKKSINTILLTLESAKRQQLQTAFEEGLINQYVEYSPGLFIGVNIQGLPNLSVEETEGYYSIGTIIQGQQNA